MANISRPWLANTAKTAAVCWQVVWTYLHGGTFFARLDEATERYSPKYKKTNIIICKCA